MYLLDTQTQQNNSSDVEKLTVFVNTKKTTTTAHNIITLIPLGAERVDS